MGRGGAGRGGERSAGAKERIGRGGGLSGSHTGGVRSGRGSARDATSRAPRSARASRTAPNEYPICARIVSPRHVIEEQRSEERHHPALCIGSMFCGRVASSATVCTKVTRSFWYFSNTCSTRARGRHGGPMRLKVGVATRWAVRAPAACASLCETRVPHRPGPRLSPHQTRATLACTKAEAGQ